MSVADACESLSTVLLLHTGFRTWVCSPSMSMAAALCHPSIAMYGQRQNAACMCIRRMHTCMHNKLARAEGNKHACTSLLVHKAHAYSHAQRAAHACFVGPLIMAVTVARALPTDIKTLPCGES